MDQPKTRDADTRAERGPIDRVAAAMSRMLQQRDEVQAPGPNQAAGPIERSSGLARNHFLVSPEAGKTFAAHLATQRVISLALPSSAIDPYRFLRAQVLAAMRPKQQSTLAITGVDRGHGATHIAANLAMSLALDPQNAVLLVDGNLRHPRLHQVFGTRLSPGLSDYLAHGATLNQMMEHPPIEGLTLLPAGEAVSNGPELLGSRQMQQLIQTLKSQSPTCFVIFDLPAVSRYPDALSFAPLVDATLLVVQERKSGAEKVSRAGKMLTGANLIGTVLNRATQQLR